jgi:mRNA-degrading endonuclease toxin of MazEF toxin-antitoxin module
VVLTPDWAAADSAADLLMVVPVSASAARSALRPVIAAGNGLDRESVAVCDSAVAITAGRLLERLGSVDQAVLAEITRVVVALVGGPAGTWAGTGGVPA